MKRQSIIKGFTLVEILIVVIILAIIAAIALPKFSNASAAARASMLADDLRIIRTQLAVFKCQHSDIPAGCASPTGDATLDLFTQHLTMATNEAGAVAALGTAGYKYGPYLREVPPNPINGKATVLVVPNSSAVPASASDAYGWIYQPGTVTFKSDAAGEDEAGKSFIDY
ncbi:MAG: prepilin-type N-terminal cleavage/methylation domain-containing protein [Phycisphaerae bacterium]